MTYPKVAPSEVDVSNFWEEGGSLNSDAVHTLDAHLSGNTVVRDYIRGLTAVAREIPSGTRVAFDGKLSSLLCYPEPPGRGEGGTVVKVRTSSGDTTEFNGLVFVKWDDGRFFGVHRNHLRSGSKSRTATAYRMTVTAMGDLTDFMKSGSDEELVHKSSRDLWKLSKAGGEFIIERLFDETGNPLKV